MYRHVPPGWEASISNLLLYFLRCICKPLDLQLPSCACLKECCRFEIRCSPSQMWLDRGGQATVDPRPQQRSFLPSLLAHFGSIPSAAMVSTEPRSLLSPAFRTCIITRHPSLCPAAYYSTIPNASGTRHDEFEIHPPYSEAIYYRRTPTFSKNHRESPELQPRPNRRIKHRQSGVFLLLPGPCPPPFILHSCRHDGLLLLLTLLTSISSIPKRQHLTSTLVSHRSKASPNSSFRIYIPGRKLYHPRYSLLSNRLQGKPTTPTHIKTLERSKASPSSPFPNSLRCMCV